VTGTPRSPSKPTSKTSKTNLARSGDTWYLEDMTNYKNILKATLAGAFFGVLFTAALSHPNPTPPPPNGCIPGTPVPAEVNTSYDTWMNDYLPIALTN
jgi:hypothetical protein